MHYEEQTLLWNAELGQLTQRSNRFSNVRLLLFLAAIVLLGVAIWRNNWWIALGAVAALGAYLVAVFRHDSVEQARKRAAALVDFNTEGSARLDRRWDDIPFRHVSTTADEPPLAYDLDITGRASLLHLLNTAYTNVGQARLREWLLHPADLPTITQRQSAVRELVELADFRANLAVSAYLLGQEQHTYEQFLDWAEAQPVLLKRPLIIWLSRLLPLVSLALMIGFVLGALQLQWWILALIINQAFSVVFGGGSGHTMSTVAAGQSSFRTYGALFRQILDQPFHEVGLRQIQAQLQTGPGRADAQMRRLARITSFVDLRLSLIYPLIQIATLWSFHITWLLELWQRDVGPFARPWLMALAELEALSALATLAYDHPHWTFPTLDASATCYEAADIGHPLLPPQKVHTNSLTVGPPGTFMLITGSNMSGKSTLLRSVGLNAVLAQAGGPVCASALHMPPLILATSIRVQDSLEHGVSYYMAELQRLKEVVEIAEAADERLVLFLLDEILHGTNTTERQIAARRIIRHLLRQHTIGMVSTHDLTLAAAPDITQASQPYYFTEHFERGPDGPTMTFDYTLRSGLATSTNALNLMEIVGLPTEDA